MAHSSYLSFFNLPLAAPCSLVSLDRAKDHRFVSKVRSHRLLENRVRLWKSLWCSSFIVDQVSVQLTQVGPEVEPQICNPTQLGIEQLSLAAPGVNPAPKLLAETTSLAI